MNPDFTSPHGMLQNVVLNLFPNDIIHAVYDVKWSIHPVGYEIPEKRLVIAYTYVDNPITNDGLTRENAQSRDYRWISVSFASFLEMRNDILYKLNQMDVLDVEGGSPLLHPKLSGDAGWDIVTQEDIICNPNTGTDIGSNLQMALPNHLYAIVQARSSTSKKNLLVLPGVIDPGYRGRIYVMAYNLSNRPIKVSKGDRIAQLLIFQRVSHLGINIVKELRPSERGTNGFGSTG